MNDQLFLLSDSLGDDIDPQPSSGQPGNGAPFDRGDSDITIRSCDRVHFQVHKAILGIASTVFEYMFTAPGSLPHGHEQVKQVIDLTEDSKTLLQLLSVMYPMDPIFPDTFAGTPSLLSACQKYQMGSTVTHIRALMRECMPSLFTTENSFRAYGTASRYQLEEEALHAARLTLEFSMDFNTIGEDLRFISGIDLFRLHEFRNECTEVAKDCIEKMIDREPIPSHPIVLPGSMMRPMSSDPHRIAPEGPRPSRPRLGHHINPSSASSPIEKHFMLPPSFCAVLQSIYLLPVASYCSIT
jgi:hypothetical protein